MEKNKNRRRGIDPLLRRFYLFYSFRSGTNIMLKLTVSRRQQIQMDRVPKARVRMLPKPAPTPKIRITLK